ncbi:MAG: hypothetical protein JST30_05490 [Armatimonadetes bacterium]|nr:hypothetical protein [Armatimonadota bacterium]
MSFAVQLASDVCQVEPGSTVPVAIEVVNRTDSADRFEIEIEGLDPRWAAVPVPSFQLEAREARTERIFLKPPRESESTAGVYPFVVKVRSLETGDVRSAQCALEVKPFSSFSLDVQPKRGKVSPFSGSTRFDVTVMNLGNGEQTLQMFATDTEAMFAFEFDADQVTLAPGQQRSLSLTVAATKSSLLANSRLQNFTVTARSTDNPAVAAAGTGQIEQRALATPGTFLMLLVVIGALFAWVVYWPKPPKIESLVTSADTVTVGQPVEIKWKASRATSVKIQVGNWSKDRLFPDGQTVFTPDTPGDYLVELTAVNGDQATKDTSKLIKVLAPVQVPKPVIEQISVEPKQVDLGQPYMLNYKFSPSVTRAVLHPAQRDLDVKEESIQLVADTVGKVRLTVKAFNSAGDQVESSVTVNVIKQSKAKILQFSATPLEFEPGGGTTTLSFVLTGAAKIELYSGGDKTVIDQANEVTVANDRLTGSKSFTVTADRTFKLVVYDDEGVPVTSTVTVKVKPADTATEPATTGGETTGGTGH